MRLAYNARNHESHPVPWQTQSHHNHAVSRKEDRFSLARWMEGGPKVSSHWCSLNEKSPMRLAASKDNQTMALSLWNCHSEVHHSVLGKVKHFFKPRGAGNLPMSRKW